MILLESGKRNSRSFDAKILFAMQLAHRGYDVVIDENAIPDDIDRHQKCEAAPFLTNLEESEISGLILIGAENISDETLAGLRSLELDSAATVAATGRFGSYQGLVGSSSKIAYAIGLEPTVVDLNDLQKQPLFGSSIAPLTATRVKSKPTAEKNVELFVYVPADWLDDPLTLPALARLHQFNGFNLSIVITGAGKDQIRTSSHSDLNVYGLTELSPSTFAKIADAAAFFGDGVPGERMANFALDLMRSGGALIDCTSSASFAERGAPALRGPQDIGALGLYFENTVAPNLPEIARQADTNEWLETNSMRRLEAAMGLRQSTVTSAQQASNPKTVFVPTNGNGLGHAQRCTLIAAEFETKDRVEFSAFPSCVKLIQSKGFSCKPLVQKSDTHIEPFANDLVNYLRLKRTMHAGDTLVFDGGHVFDSIYRTIIENQLNGIWIRRGNWQSGQVRPSALTREKAFSRVIVPMEAFDELNSAYTFGDKVKYIGPIVQRAGGSAASAAVLRSKLAKMVNRDIDEVIVTMLGGGAAADRSAQIHALCAMAEQRSDCLHLVVVWPGAKVAPGLANWTKTQVVKTQNALALCQAADLVVSAAGYNSFHEILYHKLPAILIPQMAPFMDDQEKRAQAAADRGLATMIEGQELLSLEREVSAYLDHGKAAEIRAALETAKLPELGNRAAASLIESEAQNV